MNPSYRFWPFCNETVQSVLEPHLDIFLHFYLIHEQLKIVNKIERNCLSTWMSKMCLDTIYVWILTKDHLLDGACPTSNQMNVLTHLGKTWKLISKGSICTKPIISPESKSNPDFNLYFNLVFINRTFLTYSNKFYKSLLFLIFCQKICWSWKFRICSFGIHNLKCECSYSSRDIRPNQLEHTLLRVPSA